MAKTPPENRRVKENSTGYGTSIKLKTTQEMSVVTRHTTLIIMREMGKKGGTVKGVETASFSEKRSER